MVPPNLPPVVPDLPTVPGASLTDYFQTIDRIPVLPPDIVAAMAARIQAGDPAAAHLLLVHNLRLAAREARLLHPASREAETGWELSDTVQAANLGLWQAVQRFDPTISRFSTYAVWWIRAAIGHEIARYGEGTFQPPHHWIAAIHHYLTAVAAAEDPSDFPALATTLGWPLPKVQAVAQYVARQRVWLDARVANPQPSADVSRDTLEAVIPDPHGAVWSQVVRRLEAQTLQAAVRRLPPREATVLWRRYGLGESAVQPLAAMSRALKVQPRQVQRILQQGVRHLRADPHLRALHNIPDRPRSGAEVSSS